MKSSMYFEYTRSGFHTGRGGGALSRRLTVKLRNYAEIHEVNMTSKRVFD